MAVVSDTQWALFCKAFDLADLQADPRLVTNNDRVQARGWLIAALRERMALHSAAELSSIFEANGLPFAPITRPQDLFHDPHLLATGALAPIELPDGRAAQVPLMPITLGGHRPGVHSNAPRLGQHTDALLQQMGYSIGEIARLKDAKAAA